MISPFGKVSEIGPVSEQIDHKKAGAYYLVLRPKAQSKWTVSVAFFGP